MAGRTIPVDEVIAEACTILKRVTEQEKVFMRQWAFTAMRKIGFSKLNLIISDRLFLDDWSAQKPDNLIRTIDLALYGGDDREKVHKFKGYGTGWNGATNPPAAWVTSTAYALRDRVTQNSEIYKCIVAHTSGVWTTDFETSEYWELSEAISSRIHQELRPSIGAVNITESDNYFNVEEFDGTAADDAYLIVKYYGVMQDENGLPKIPEYATLAVIMYIRAMWEMRENNNQSAIQLAWNMWQAERNAADAKGNTPDMIEGKAIAKTINSMIQKVDVHNRQF